MSIQAIAWDIDGTLVDSEPLHLRALLAVCEAHSVNIADLPYEHFIGVDLHNVWLELKTRFPADLTEQTWIQRLNSYYQVNAHHLKPVKHAQKTVREIACMGIPQVAVSNSNRIIVDTNLIALGISDLMEFSISLDDVQVGKPDPAPYLVAAKRLSLPPSTIVAIEDSSAGIRSARAAGIKVIGYGETTTDIESADIKVESLLDILSHVQADLKND